MEWRRVLTGVILLLACFFAGSLASQPDNTTNYENCKSIEKLSKILGAYGQSDSEENPTNHADSTNCRPPKWYAIFQRIEGWQLIIAAIGIGIIGWQSWETRKAAETALRNTNAFIQSQRPWISPRVSIGGPLTYDQQGARVALVVALDNLGQIPALGIWVHIEMYISSPKKRSPMDESKRICAEIARRKPDWGNVIFPRNTFTRQYGISASATEIESCNRDICGEGSTSKFYSTEIIVAVAYTTDIDKNARYHTAMIYTLTRVDMDHPAFKYGLLIGESVPQEKLRLLHYPIAGITAK